MLTYFSLFGARDPRLNLATVFSWIPQGSDMLGLMAWRFVQFSLMAVGVALLTALLMRAAAGRIFMRTPTFQDALIAAANSPTGRWARIVGGAVAILAGWRLRGWAGVGLAVAGALASVPALWGFCL